MRARAYRYEWHSMDPSQQSRWLFLFVLQGSHVTSHEGTYVLQWKFYDKLAHQHHSALDSLTAAASSHVHKAKVNKQGTSGLNKSLTSGSFVTGYVLLWDAQLHGLQGFNDQPAILPVRIFHDFQTFDFRCFVGGVLTLWEIFPGLQQSLVEREVTLRRACHQSEELAQADFPELKSVNKQTNPLPVWRVTVTKWWWYQQSWTHWATKHNNLNYRM